MAAVKNLGLHTASQFRRRHSCGRSIRDENLSNGSSAAKRAGVPRIRFHDLRHTHASHLLRAGVHPKVVSERLGHSRVGITMALLLQKSVCKPFAN
ncbi:MAG TPA: tyrosine-type recombinase/integrase [Candidatus Acidoferrales bacterium]|nr:tyrosine-type recombinase/integrase [Candidatus Acidoferrales bacterium]